MSDVLLSLTFEMIAHFKGDQRRIHHALKVHSFASLLGRKENLDPDQQLCLEASGLLHDMGIHECEKKYHSTAGNLQEIEGPPLVEKLLPFKELTPDVQNRILFLIGHHHTPKYIDGPDFQILMEADFLVNMFVDDLSIGQIRTISKNLFKTPSSLALLKQLIPSL